MGELITAAIGVFKTPFTLFGVTMNYWQIYLFFGFTPIVIWILWRIFIDD